MQGIILHKVSEHMYSRSIVTQIGSQEEFFCF